MAQSGNTDRKHTQRQLCSFRKVRTEGSKSDLKPLFKVADEGWR